MSGEQRKGERRSFRFPSFGHTYVVCASCFEPWPKHNPSMCRCGWRVSAHAGSARIKDRRQAPAAEAEPRCGTCGEWLCTAGHTKDEGEWQLWHHSGVNDPADPPGQPGTRCQRKKNPCRCPDVCEIHGTPPEGVGSPQPCGHPHSAIVVGPEGTAYCGECEAAAGRLLDGREHNEYPGRR
jgi:hypothetical protein